MKALLIGLGLMTAALTAQADKALDIVPVPTESPRLARRIRIGYSWLPTAPTGTTPWLNR